MKKITTLITFCLFSSFGFCQDGPKIEFSASENTIDYGSVSKGNESGIRAFTYTNTGNAPLIITAIQATPSTTILSKQNETILPGKSGKIEIKYNMAVGPIRKTITVETNAVNYDQGRVPLKIKGEVIAN